MWPFRKKRLALDRDEPIRRYAREALPALLGLPAEPRQVRVQQFNTGRASWVRLVDVEGYGKLVLRVRHRRRDLAKLAGRERLDDILRAHDIPAPRLLLTDSAPATWRRHGFWAQAEEFLEGRLVSDLAPQEAAAPLLDLADVVARLHAIRHPQAARPWLREKRDLRRWARRLCAQRVERVRSAGFGLGRERGRALARWFGDGFHRLSRGDHPLVHGDLTGHNLLVTDDGRLHLLDLRATAHWLPQYDLVVAEHWVERCAPGHASAFLDRYFRGATASPALSRPAYQETRALFFAWFYLDCTAGLIRRGQRQAARGTPAGAHLREAQRFWGLTERCLAEAGAP